MTVSHDQSTRRGSQGLQAAGPGHSFTRSCYRCAARSMTGVFLKTPLGSHAFHCVACAAAKKARVA